MSLAKSLENVAGKVIAKFGGDVTIRYVELNPNDVEITNRLDGMRNDMTACLALLYNKK